MAFQPETSTYDSGVYQIETLDPVQGGVGGLANKPLLSLANRTVYLKAHMDAIENGTFVPTGLAVLNSPTFTGDPKAPTPALGDNDTSIATSAFVQGTINGVLTKSVAGGVNVTLSAIEAGNGIFIFTGALTANIAVIVPNTGKQMLVVNRTSGAYTLTIKTAAGGGIVVAQNKQQELGCDGSSVILASNDFTGISIDATATVPNAPIDTNTQQIASTAFVLGQASALTPIMDGIAAIGAATRFARADHVHPTDTSLASLASPIFTGDPKAPTAAQFDNDTSLATSAFVQRALGNNQGYLAFSAGGNPAVVAADAGKHIVLTGSVNGTLFLPVLSTVVDGTAFLVKCETSTATWNVGSAGADGNAVIFNNGSFANIPFGRDDYGIFVKGGAGWRVYGSVTLPYSGLLQGANFVTPPQFASDKKLATTEFVRRAGFQGSNVFNYSASTQLPQSAIGGHMIFGMSAINQLVTLPDLTSVPAGSMMTFYNYGGNNFTLAPYGNQSIMNQGALGNFLMPANSTLILITESGGSTGRWDVIGGTAQLPTAPTFAANFNGGAGYQKLPSGLIIQWGGFSQNENANSATGFGINYAIAFPNAGIHGYLTVGNNINATSVFGSIESISTTGFSGYTFSSNSIARYWRWLVIGY